MNPNNQALPPECFACGETTQWKLERDKAIMKVKGESLEVPSEFYGCEHCGHEFMTPSQLKADLLVATRLYQEKHNLLTAQDVKTRRTSLTLSQDAFCTQAKGVTLSSLKRLELGQRVQDESTDVAIRASLDDLEEKSRDCEIIEFAQHHSSGSTETWSTNCTNSLMKLSLAASITLAFSPLARQPQTDNNLAPLDIAAPCA